MKFRLIFRITFLLFLLSITIKAQSNDSLKNKEFSQPGTPLLNNHSSKAAAIMSAIVPGLGQAYNKKHWKIPIIYAGFAGLGYAFKINQDKYILYKDVYNNRMDHDSSDIFNYTNENLKTLINSYHKYRDLFAITLSAIYLLNIVDASVDAHLFTFDVSDNLSLRVLPYINYIYKPTASLGVIFTYHFNNVPTSGYRFVKHKTI